MGCVAAPRAVLRTASQPRASAAATKIRLLRNCVDTYGHRRQASSHRKADLLSLWPLLALAFASTTQVGFQAAVLLILILGAPLNHDGRTQALRSGYPGMDAGIAALGHGWPVAAAHGVMPE